MPVPPTLLPHTRSVGHSRRRMPWFCGVRKHRSVVGCAQCAVVRGRAEIRPDLHYHVDVTQDCRCDWGQPQPHGLCLKSPGACPSVKPRRVGLKMSRKPDATTGHRVLTTAGLCLLLGVLSVLVGGFIPQGRNRADEQTTRTRTTGRKRSVEGLALAEGQSGAKAQSLTCDDGGVGSTFITGGTQTSVQYINSPGLWCLKSDLIWSSSSTGVTPIIIESGAEGTTFDMNGYSIVCLPGTCPQGQFDGTNGIRLNSGSHIRIQNGSIRGFTNGIFFTGNSMSDSASFVQVKDMIISSSFNGIHFWWGTNYDIGNTTFFDIVSRGIWADAVNGNYNIHNNIFHTPATTDDIRMDLAFSGIDGHAIVANNQFIGGGDAVSCSSGSNVKVVGNLQFTTSGYGSFCNLAPSSNN